MRNSFSSVTAGKALIRFLAAIVVLSLALSSSAPRPIALHRVEAEDPLPDGIITADGGVSIEGVIGSDDRVRVEATTEFPWRAIADLDVDLLSVTPAMAASETGEAIAEKAEEGSGEKCPIDSQGNPSCKEWVRLILKRVGLWIPSGYCYDGQPGMQRLDQSEADRGDIVQFYWPDSCRSDASGVHTAIILDPRDHNELEVAHCNWAGSPCSPAYACRSALNVQDHLSQHPDLAVAFWRFTEPPRDEGVTLYEHAHYGGSSWTFTEPDGDLCNNVIDWGGNSPGASRPCDIPGVKTMNDIASSLKVAPGWEARLHIHNAQDAERWGDDATQGFHCGADMADFAEHSFPNDTPLNDNVSRVLVARCAPAGGAQLSLSASQDDICRPDPGPCVDRADFLDVESYPDGTVVQPGQSMDKWWRVRNTGTCDWNGYQLMFESGEQMGGPSPVSIPHTPTGGTVDIHVPMEAPTPGGQHAGYWRIVSPSGVWVDGGLLWIEVQVPGGPEPPPSGGDIELADLVYPTVVTPGQSFRPQVTVRVNQGQLLETRGDMLRNSDGNLYGAWPHVAVVGSVSASQTYTFEFYENDPITAPVGEGQYYSRWRVWRDGNWAGPEITIEFEVRIGGGTRPSPPTLDSPDNWYVSRDGTTPPLCASAPGGLEYYFQIYESHSTPESGWISSNCWTPPSLGPYTYKWHAKVKDPSTGLESDWSEDRHFSIDSQELTIDPLEFQPGSPSDADEVRVYTCLHGFGGIGLGLKIEANTATDCSADGDWQWIHHLGTFCYDHDNPNAWPNWGTPVQPDGNHLVRATGSHGHDTIVTEACYRLDYRRPSGVLPISPLQDTWWQTRQITFRWEQSLRTDEYHLAVSANPDPAQNPIVDLNLNPSITQYTYTLSQDYQALYWKVIASNSKGSAEMGPTQFGIDPTPAVSSVDPLEAVHYEPHFVVSWDGSDDRSGLRWYDVQYRDGDRGEWINWLTHVDTTVAMFHGEPGHTYCFRSRAMDTAGNWESYPTDHGDTCTTVDVTAAPPTPWWDTDYASKRNIVILNNDTHTLPAGYPVRLHFDAATSPTAAELYASSLSATKGDDFRIIYENTTELDRWIRDFDAGNIDIWFKSTVQLGGLSSDESSHQLYYGNASGSAPPGTINDIIPEPTDGNTLGLWHFQEGSGSTVSDSSANGHHGTAANMAWTEGKFGAAGVFNGTNSFVNLGTSTAFNSPHITLEAWIKLTSQSWSPEWTILRKDSNDGSLIYDFLIQEERLYLRLNGNHGWIRTNATLETDRWYHVAGTYDGSAIKVYIGGRLDNSVAYNVPLRYGSSTTLYLGWNGWNDSAHFPGHIQNARISNVARTSFAYGPFGDVTSEPTLAAGSPQAPPASGSADLVLQSLSAYPTGSGLEGGMIVQAVLTNEGDRATENGFFTDLYADHLPVGPGDYSGSVHFWIANPIQPGATISVTTVLTDVLSAFVTTSSDASISESTTTLYGQVDSTGVIIEPDDDNNISAGAEVCIALDDAYEADNGYTEAQPISGVQTHNIGALADEDWVSFQAEGGEEYTLMTSDLGLNADTYLYLYDTDGQTLLAAKDDYGGTLASRIDWVAPATATYYVAVKHWNPNVAGCGTNYDLQVSHGRFYYFPLALRGYASTSALAELVPTATPTPSLGPTATWIATPTFTATPTVTETATSTPTASASSTPTVTPAPIHTSTPTDTPTATPTEAVIPTPTEVATPSPTRAEEP